MIRSFEGKTPQIHPTAYISEAAYVVGDVVVGEQASVWPMAVIRGDNARITLGKGTNVQDGAIVHADYEATIGEYVGIGHASMVHATRIGNHCVIGNNATVLEDVELGDFCLVAAGSVVPPGKKIPSYSFLIGSPAEIRPLTPKHQDLLDRQGRRYVEKGRRHKAAGLDRPSND